MKRLIITLILAATAVSAQVAVAADGEAVFKKVCFACHDTGAAGAPKRGDAAAWAPRVAKGVDALVASVANGLNAMPPKGTCTTCSDEELRAGVEYLVAQAEAGATAQPAAAPAAAPAPAPAQAAAEPAAEPKPEVTTQAALTPGDAARGQAKSALCLACHGPDGNSPANPLWPKLAGQAPGYIVKQLHALKDGKLRKNDLMSPMAAMLSDQDMLDVAAYFSAQTPSDGQGNPDLLADGGKLYTRGNLSTGVVACAGCHGPDGLGNPQAGFPRLAKQHAAYIAKALQDYRSKARTNDLNGIMQGVAANLTNEEIAAVAEYVTNLK